MEPQTNTPFVADEEVKEITRPKLELCPEPAAYTDGADGSGNLLSFFIKDGKKHVVYHSLIVKETDTQAMTCFVDVDGGDKDFVFGICGENEQITMRFVEHFSGNLFLRPLKPGRVQRLCVCPMHRQVSLVSPMDDLLVTCFCIPVLGEMESAGCSGLGSSWRLAVENGSPGAYVRFFDCQRSSNCFCKFPTVFSP
jgi:hypothetical protein